MILASPESCYTVWTPLIMQTCGTFTVIHAQACCRRPQSCGQHPTALSQSALGCKQPNTLIELDFKKASVE